MDCYTSKSVLILCPKCVWGPMAIPLTEAISGMLGLGSSNIMMLNPASLVHTVNNPDSKVHGANMGPIWGRQDPDGPHVGPMKNAIWELVTHLVPSDYLNQWWLVVNYLSRYYLNQCRLINSQTWLKNIHEKLYDSQLFSSVHWFPSLHIVYLLNITFIFDRCLCSDPE